MGEDELQFDSKSEKNLMNPMNKIPAVHIVIANWNDEQTTAKCLEHIQKLDYSNYYVTVVDSGSSDGSGERIKQNYPWLNLIRLQENYGHTHAANVGANFIDSGKSKYILFLDNDAYLEASCLKFLVTNIETDYRFGMACPLIYSEKKPGSIWYSGGHITILGNAHHDNMYKGIRFIDEKTRIVEYATSCVLLVRRDVFEKTGGFAEELFNYSEDLDLSWKVRKLGYDLIFVPAAHATHGESINVINVAGKIFRDYYTMRNRLFIIRRYGNIFQKSVGIILTGLWYAFGYGVIHLIRGEWKRTKYLLLGVLDFFQGRLGKRDL